jgi:hypothetical protein
MRELRSERVAERPLGLSRRLETQSRVVLCNSFTGMFGVFQVSLQSGNPDIESIKPTFNRGASIHSSKLSFGYSSLPRESCSQNLKLIWLQIYGTGFPGFTCMRARRLCCLAH